jgi:hypothetical protein
VWDTRSGRAREIERERQPGAEKPNAQRPLARFQKIKRLSHKTSPSPQHSDEENPYLRAAPPSAPRRTLAARAIADVRARWWLWGAALFAAALATTLVAFRGQLYDLSARGMPLLAVKGNAAEACTTMCEDAVAEAAKAVKGASAAGAAGATSPAAASPAESFEACYAKCVAQETKDVAREREEFKKEEAEIEKEEAADKAAAEAAAAKAAKPVDAAPKPAVPKPPVVAVAAAAASKPPAEAAPKPAAPKPPVVEAAKPATPVAPKP